MHLERESRGQRVAYLRVPSAGQILARQREAAGECDQAVTERLPGNSSTDRPQLQALIRHVRHGDYIVVASKDRLARSVIDHTDIVQQITGEPAEHTEQHPRKGASVEFLKERLTFAPPRRPGSDDLLPAEHNGSVRAVRA